MSQDVVGITVRLSKSEHDRLRSLAESEHRSLAGEIRKAVLDHAWRARRAGVAAVVSTERGPSPCSG
jgi:predicted transcriptional regulator